MSDDCRCGQRDCLICGYDAPEVPANVRERREPVRRKRPKTHVENHDFAAFVRRIIAAHGRRVGADVDALGDLASLGRDIERALAAGVEALRTEGRSWAEIGDRLDISRQAAQQRWGG